MQGDPAGDPSKFTWLSKAAAELSGQAPEAASQAAQQAEAERQADRAGGSKLTRGVQVQNVSFRSKPFPWWAWLFIVAAMAAGVYLLVTYLG